MPFDCQDQQALTTECKEAVYCHQAHSKTASPSNFMSKSRHLSSHTCHITSVIDMCCYTVLYVRSNLNWRLRHLTNTDIFKVPPSPLSHKSGASWENGGEHVHTAPYYPFEFSAKCLRAYGRNFSGN